MKLSELRADLRRRANAKIAAGSERIFKTGPGEYGEGDVFSGIRVPELRKLARSCRSLSIRDTKHLLASRIH